MKSRTSLAEKLVTGAKQTRNKLTLWRNPPVARYPGGIYADTPEGRYADITKREARELLDRFWAADEDS